jgi:arylsulfatase A-like enzyme
MLKRARFKTQCAEASLASLLLLLSLAACHAPLQEAPLRGMNVVLIVVDTLRADHLGCYGYGRATSPVIDDLARNGVVFERSRSTSSYTRESVAALFTGQLPSHSGAIGWSAAPLDGSVVLAERLRAAGYRSGFVTNTNMLTAPGFTRGFEVVRPLESAWGVSRTGGRVTSAALEVAAQLQPGPFFLYLHYLDPHGPYDPPPDLRQRFVVHADVAEVDVYRDLRPQLPLFVQQGFGPGESRFEQMVSRYDAEIADTDRAIAALLAGLERLGLLQRTLVVLTADHGEEFLEHGFIEHAWTLYEESVRVPLIWSAPGRLPQGMRSPQPATTLDIAPTLLELLDLPAVADMVDGATLFEKSAALRNGATPRPYIGELRIAQRNVVRALVQGRWKYLATQRWIEPSERAAALQAPETGDAATMPENAPLAREELYDLDADRAERHDLVGSAPPILSALRQQLAAQFADTSPVASSTAPTIGPADRERLRALGYVE